MTEYASDFASNIDRSISSESIRIKKGKRPLSIRGSGKHALTACYPGKPYYHVRHHQARFLTQCGGTALHTSSAAGVYVHVHALACFPLPEISGKLTTAAQNDREEKPRRLGEPLAPVLARLMRGTFTRFPKIKTFYIIIFVISILQFCNPGLFCAPRKTLTS